MSDWGNILKRVQIMRIFSLCVILMVIIQFRAIAQENAKVNHEIEIDSIQGPGIYESP